MVTTAERYRQIVRFFTELKEVGSPFMLLPEHAEEDLRVVPDVGEGVVYDAGVLLAQAQDEREVTDDTRTHHYLPT